MSNVLSLQNIGFIELLLFKYYFFIFRVTYTFLIERYFLFGY